MDRLKDYTLDEYLKYNDILETAVKGKSDEIIFNDSFVHAEMVLTSILKSTMEIDKDLKTYTKEINIYCGKFSLFRDSAKNKIDEIREKIKPDSKDNNYSEKYDKWRVFNPYEKMMSVFIDYMNEGGCLNVIVEKDIFDIINENVWLRIKKYVGKQLNIKKTGVPIGLNHYIVSNRCYRIEDDDNSKTAICCFNDEETCNTLISNFQTLSLLSEPYNFC